MLQHLNDDYKKKLKTMIPKGDFGKPQDVASTVLFLLSEASNYITGQVLRVDGGMVLS